MIRTRIIALSCLSWLCHKARTMNDTVAAGKKFTLTEWLVIIVAVIGFAFDTYELLMTPLIAGPALAEILQVPLNHPSIKEWVGRLLWLSALSGGIFGLLGGWLTDRFGRKTVLFASIGVYSISPVLAALSTTLEWFIFFRCTTFVGVCVEFIAAITWLAELFPDKRRKELVLGVTQAFASIGGLMVTGMSAYILANANGLPALPLPEPFNAHASWRYLLMTGLLPALPIALLLPFVPESQAWLERRKAGTLRRPSLLELFSPQLRRATLVTAGLSACAYGAAFGALQLTPTQIVPGLSDLAAQRAVLKPLQEEAREFIKQLDEVRPRFQQACAEVPGLQEVASQRARVRIAMRETRKGLDSTNTSPGQLPTLSTKMAGLTNRLAELDGEVTRLTEGKPEAKKTLMEREKILGQLGGNREKQEPADKVIKARGNSVQLYQEFGGLAGRIALALLLVAAIGKRTLLRLFQVPGLIVLPLTYVFLFRSDPELFKWGMAAAGFLTVAQFSFFGEYLPRIFPMHLRGTGGSFATNVGGRMFGTSAAYITTVVLAPRFGGTPFDQVATAAAIVGTAVFVIGLGLSFLLPEPKAEARE